MDPTASSPDLDSNDALTRPVDSCGAASASGSTKSRPVTRVSQNPLYLDPLSKSSTVMSQKDATTGFLMKDGSLGTTSVSAAGTASGHLRIVQVCQDINDTSNDEDLHKHPKLFPGVQCSTAQSSAADGGRGKESGCDSGEVQGSLDSFEGLDESDIDDVVDEFELKLRKDALKYLENMKTRMSHMRETADREVLALQYIPVHTDRLTNLPEHVKCTLLSLFISLVLIYIDNNINLDNNKSHSQELVPASSMSPPSVTFVLSLYKWCDKFLQSLNSSCIKLSSDVYKALTKPYQIRKAHIIKYIQTNSKFYKEDENSDGSSLEGSSSSQPRQSSRRVKTSCSVSTPKTGISNSDIHDIGSTINMNNEPLVDGIIDYCINLQTEVDNIFYITIDKLRITTVDRDRDNVNSITAEGEDDEEVSYMYSKIVRRIHPKRSDLRSTLRTDKELWGNGDTLTADAGGNDEANALTIKSKPEVAEPSDGKGPKESLSEQVPVDANSALLLSTGLSKHSFSNLKSHDTYTISASTMTDPQFFDVESDSDEYVKKDALDAEQQATAALRSTVPVATTDVDNDNKWKSENEKDSKAEVGKLDVDLGTDIAEGPSIIGATCSVEASNETYSYDTSDRTHRHPYKEDDERACSGVVSKLDIKGVGGWTDVTAAAQSDSDPDSRLTSNNANAKNPSSSNTSSGSKTTSDSNSSSKKGKSRFTRFWSKSTSLAQQEEPVMAPLDTPVAEEADREPDSRYDSECSSSSIPSYPPKAQTVLLRDLITSFVLSGGFDSRAQYVFSRFSIAVGLNEAVLIRIEENLAADLLGTVVSSASSSSSALASSSSLSSTQGTVTESRSAVRARRWKIAGAAVGGGLLVAVTAGLAAPALAAALTTVGIGTTATGFIASTGGTALIASMFGAGGAGLTGYKYNNIPNFLSVGICISGWLSSTSDVVLPWTNGIPQPKSDLYALKWEPGILKALGNMLIKMLSQDFAINAGKIWVKYMISASLMTALMWPLALMQFAASLDNTWLMCRERAQQAGKLLADAVSDKQAVGQRPVTLIGFSMGARVIFYCLQELHKKKRFNCVGDVVLMGMPASLDKRQWTKARQVVANRLVNVYCRSDWVLGFLYRYMEWGIKVAGLSPVESVKGIDNFDVSGLIRSHGQYVNKCGDVLTFIGFEV